MSGRVNELVTLGLGGKGRGRESVLRLETIASGYMNAVVFWFDLHMDEYETITTAPPGVGKGGMLLEEEAFEGDAKGLAAARHGPSTHISFVRFFHSFVGLFILA